MRLLALIFLTLMLASPLAAQDTPPTPDTITPELAAQMDRLERYTQNTRALNELSDVPRAFPSRDDVRAYLAELYGADEAVDDIARAETLYKALWLLPRDVNLMETYLNLLGSQVAGFYETDTQIMNVIPSFGETGALLSFTEQIIYVHEFVHALQDQHFDLDRLLGNDESAAVVSPDQGLAVLALIEGDATAVMNLYSTQATALNPALSLQLIGEGLLAGNLFLPPGIPAILTRELAFPYEDGLNFVLEVWRMGGWEAVDSAFAAPPTTTEQILHPEAYFAGEIGADMTFDDVGSALGDGYSEVWATTLGEFYLREHLRAGGASLSAARDAAAGWGGDFIRIYTRDGADGSPRYAWQWRLAWDTPEDAAAFKAAYEDIAAARYGGERVDGCWRDETSSLCLNIVEDQQTIQYIEVG
jgi:hypothetical protein